MKKYNIFKIIINSILRIDPSSARERDDVLIRIKEMLHVYYFLKRHDWQNKQIVSFKSLLKKRGNLTLRDVN